MRALRSTLALGSAAGLVGLAGVAAAQSSVSQPGAGLGLGTRIVIRFVVTAVLNLLVGALGYAIAPEYVRRSVENIRQDAGAAVGWGLLMGLVVPIVLGLLAVTVIGLLITIPGIVVLFVIGLVGSAVTVNWVGTWIGADTQPSMKGAAIGALLMGAMYAIPLLGDLLLWVVSLFGLGIVSKQLYDERSGGGSGTTTQSGY